MPRSRFVAVWLDRQAGCGSGQLGEALPDPLWAVAADGLATPHPAGPASRAASANSSRNQSSVRDPVLGVDPDGLRATGPRGRDGGGHLRDDRRTVKAGRGACARSSGPTWRSTSCRSAAPVLPSQAASAPGERGVDVRRSSPAPAESAASPPNAPASASTTLAGMYRNLVEQERKTDLPTARYRAARDVEVDHRSCRTSTGRCARSHAVAVGHIQGMKTDGIELPPR